MELIFLNQASSKYDMENWIPHVGYLNAENNFELWKRKLQNTSYCSSTQEQKKFVDEFITSLSFVTKW
jgi:hypothetical protein